jgi:Uncharacterized protein containing a Zn-ribbon (DUF2116)
MTQSPDLYEGTDTRSELLEIRGVDAPANGHVPQPMNGHWEPRSTEPEPLEAQPTAPTCAGCGTPVDPGRKWCSERCRQRTGRARRDTTSPPPRDPAPPAIELGRITGPAAAADRLGALYNALMLAGATVTRLEVTVAEETWLITRSNGAAPWPS